MSVVLSCSFVAAETLLYIWIMTHNCKPQLFSILFFRDFNLMI